MKHIVMDRYDLFEEIQNRVSSQILCEIAQKAFNGLVIVTYDMKSGTYTLSSDNMEEVFPVN